VSATSALIVQLRDGETVRLTREENEKPVVDTASLLTPKDSRISD